MSSMTPNERALLQEFLQQLVRIRGVAKDTEANAMIEQALAQQPDAGYLLVQRALLLEQALNAAKAELTELRNRDEGGRSFLSGADAWGRERPQRQPLSVAGTPISPVPGAPVASSVASAPSPFGGFLGQAAATAAGVAGGAFLFQGLEHLFGHPDVGNYRDRFADQQTRSDALLSPQDDVDAQDITSDIDWDDFDSSDDSQV